MIDKVVDQGPHKRSHLPAAERRRQAQQRVGRALERALHRASPDEVEAFAARIERIVERNSINPSRRALIQTLTGREYPPRERLELESEMLTRAFDRRRELLAGALTASQVAALLHTTRQTPHDRVRASTLLAVFDRGAWRFPAWQFDPAGPDGVVAGLPDVLRALHVDALSKVSLLATPNPILDGEPPIEILRRGEAQRVIDLARGIGVT